MAQLGQTAPAANARLQAHAYAAGPPGQHPPPSPTELIEDARFGTVIVGVPRRQRLGDWGSGGADAES